MIPRLLHPAALWALPLLALPWVIHFWGRTRPPVLPFSNVDLLAEAVQDRWRWDRWRRWLLLMVRTALLGALVLALARPGFQGMGSTGAGRTLVLLLDASYSMRATHAGSTVFDRSRDLARALLDTTGPSDQWGLVLFSDRVEAVVAPTSDPGPIRAVLADAVPTFRGTDLSTGVARGLDLLERAGAGGALVVLSDGARHALRGAPGRGASGRSILWVDPVPLLGNAALLDVGGVGSRPRASFRRWGEGPAPRSWSLWSGGKAVARGGVPWSADRASIDIPFSLAPGLAELRLDADALSADNHFFWEVPSSGRTILRVLNGAPSLSPIGDETYFLGPALDALAGQGLRWDTAPPSETAIRDLPPGGVAALLNPSPLSVPALEALDAFVRGGGGLWLTAGDRAGFERAADFFGARAGPVREVEASLAFHDRDQILGISDGADFEWARCRIDRAVPVDPFPGGQTILTAGRPPVPILIVGSRGRGRLALWTTSVDRDWTNLPTKPLFPVLVRAVASYLSGKEAGVVPSVRVGEPLSVPVTGEGAVNARCPDGRRRPAAVRGPLAWFEGTDQPGLYAFEQAGRLLGTGIVNVDASTEGDLEPASLAERSRWLAPSPVRVIPAASARIETLRGAVDGRDLTPAVARALLLLFGLETLLLVSRRWTA